MKDIKMGYKLMASYLVMAVIAIIICMFLLSKMAEVDRGTTELYEKGVMSLNNMALSARIVNFMRITAYQAMLAPDSEKRREFRQRGDSLKNVIFQIYDEEEAITSEKEALSNIASIKRCASEYSAIYDKFIAALDKGESGMALLQELENKAGELVYFNRGYIVYRGEVAKGLDENSNVVYNSSVQNSVIVLVITVIFVVAFGIYMTFSITKPLSRVVEILKKGKSGDMCSRVGIERKDEIGVVAENVDGFFDQMQSVVKKIRINSDTVAGASEELSTISRQLASSAGETVAQSNAVASTTEQMAVNINAMAGGAEQASVNANEVAGAAEQMSTNMNTIASAVEEMSASINQIAGNTSEVRKVATDATGKALDATDVMSKLGVAAKEIGQVTNVIKNIADKTNLLALNATIEAASAGDAGKGFAVVAGEIKELANQSAKSADDIAHRIDGIQNGTNNAVEVIGGVSDIIAKINRSVEAIAGHVEQQTKASNEIANSVAQANIGAKRVAGAIGEVAKGANDVSRNAGEAAKGAQNVSSNALTMSQAAKESAQGAGQVNQSAGDLARIASELKDSVSRFKV